MLGTPVNAAARHATYAMFLADGLGFGIWAGHIPAFKQKFELSDSALSIVLLAVAAGSIVSMPVAGQAVRHFGSRRCIAVSLACYALCLASLALAPTLGLFVVAAFLFGAAKGGVDVGINAQAVIVERIYGRPIMASFQALWSVGGLAGGFLTSATLGLGSTPVVNLGWCRCTDSVARPARFLSPNARPSVAAREGGVRSSPAGKSFALRRHLHFYCLIQ
jgi:MFS family permease